MNTRKHKAYRILQRIALRPLVVKRQLVIEQLFKVIDRFGR